MIPQNKNHSIIAPQSTFHHGQNFVHLHLYRVSLLQSLPCCIPCCFQFEQSTPFGYIVATYWLLCYVIVRQSFPEYRRSNRFQVDDNCLERTKVPQSYHGSCYESDPLIHFWVFLIKIMGHVAWFGIHGWSSGWY